MTEKLLAAAPNPPVQDKVPCSTHPDAPHGFNRNSSHSLDRYVCDCEGWVPPVQVQEAVKHDTKGSRKAMTEKLPAATVGYAMVPVEPTEAMLDILYHNGPGLSDHLLVDIWAELLAAAPKPPVQEPVATIIQRAPYEDGTINPCKSLQWSGNNAEDDLAVGTKLYATPQPSDGVAKDDWTPSDYEYDRSIHHNPDAKAWAEFFVATFPALKDKEDLMHSWFANAMMAMHDYLKNQPTQVQEAVEHDTKGSRKALGAMNAKLKAKIDRLERKLAAPPPSDDVAISKMARILSDREASACCVDPDDHWKIYSQEFIDDVLVMLEGSKGK